MSTLKSFIVSLSLIETLTETVDLFTLSLIVVVLRHSKSLGLCEKEIMAPNTQLTKNCSPTMTSNSKGATFRTGNTQMVPPPPGKSKRATVLFFYLFSLVFTSFLGIWQSTSHARRYLFNGDPSEWDEVARPTTTTTTTTTTTRRARAARIAIVTGFVPDHQKKGVRLRDGLLPQMLNKACYADLWGYDLIYNTTWAFPNATLSQYWLQYGTWHRVPHIMAALPHYDWIVYADTDWIIQDLTFPLESLITDWTLHGQDAHVLVPSDYANYHTFSAFAVMIRNSPFGRRLLENWYAFSQGLCPNGNFANTDRKKYTREDSDQPGLWYALAQTHYELHRPNATKYVVRCTDAGYLNTTRVMGPELDKYFKGIKAKFGAHGAELRANHVPKEQPILWSLTRNDTKSGLGVQKTFGFNAKRDAHPNAFALHWKNGFSTKMKLDMVMCRKNLGCYANLDNVTGELQLGCRRTQVLV
jgi:galactosyl transferase GMA12/MNN10 family